jgi:hypothetical protein
MTKGTRRVFFTHPVKPDIGYLEIDRYLQKIVATNLLELVKPNKEKWNIFTKRWLTSIFEGSTLNL